MSTYEKSPVVRISNEETAFYEGWPKILEALAPHIAEISKGVVVVEVYPGVDADLLTGKLRKAFQFDVVLRSEDAFLPPEALRKIFNNTLSDDPVFDFMHPWRIDAYFDPAKLREMRALLDGARGRVLAIGTGASVIAPVPAFTISSNVGRWELQQRQRSHTIGNLGFRNKDATPGELYKTAFFLDWRVADRVRHEIYHTVDFFLDHTHEEVPKMLAGAVLRHAVRETVRRPFRVVPFFDPGPWGGQWMRREFDLPVAAQNYAWGFDCVPEENTVLFAFGERCFQLPAIVLVHEEPEALLGRRVLERFGAEFPIRFDFLDTVEGGNLSLQVHPREAYIRDHFGMPYTQDESYYMLHCEPGSSMFLGLKASTERLPMSEALYEANKGGPAFPVHEFVSEWPTKKHDHFSIPAGTVHASGAGNVVLEISATPYIFTFKLWDWGRTGLDGRPRPIHLEHGLANIYWDRTTPWVRRELVDQVRQVQQGNGWHEERTGLHSTQFLETRRHWFTKSVAHQTCGNLNVLNLVEGAEALVTSPTGAFDPMTVHFAETFIVPACVGLYVVAPVAKVSKHMATLKAYVRA
jgi:hypothetical protein